MHGNDTVIQLPVISGHVNQVFHADFFPRLARYDVTMMLDNEKTREKEDRRFRVVVLEKSNESIEDGEKDKHNGSPRTSNRNRHWSQSKLLWARFESRRDGR